MSISTKFNFFPKYILTLILVVLFLVFCSGIQYSSKRQGPGAKLYFAGKYDKVTEEFKKVIKEAKKDGELREIAHLKSLLGWSLIQLFDRISKFQYLQSSRHQTRPWFPQQRLILL